MPPVVQKCDQDEGQAGPDVEATDATSQPQPGQMDEEFTITAYPNVYENLKLTVDEPVIPEEPASSTRTLSSLQHLAKDFSIGDQFFNDKPSEADNEKTTVDTEAKSMMSVTIYQNTSAIPPMTSLVIDLVSRPDSPNVHQPLPTTTTATATTTTIMTTIPLPPQPQQVSSDSILINRLGELEQHIADLVDLVLSLEEQKRIVLCCVSESKANPSLLISMICASLESILAIEDTWERERSGFAEEKVWGALPVVTGFWGGKKTFWGV
ncbi:hypothetical protein Tco_0840348 [Tanacetum coccineum]|uniref:Uncharacterized protein n=1 Tax=Tanacetum coccineum TaxID=301880 RepID=A0ABQ5ATA0_9ASTR